MPQEQNKRDMEIENWMESQSERLESKTKNYTAKEKTKAGYSYIKSALYLAPAKIDDDAELREFKTKLEAIIDALPTKEDGGKVEYGTYPSKLSSFKKKIKKKYNIVNKGTYLSLGAALGMQFGLLLGLLLGYLALGLLMGVMLGSAIGLALENKAKKEKRILS